MARTPSYTDDIELVLGAPVARPKSTPPPDLAKFKAALTEIDRQTRLAGKTDVAIPIDMPADRIVKTDDGKDKVVSASQTAKMRFQQAAAELGIGVSIRIENVDGKTTRLHVATRERRKRKDSAPAPAAVKPTVPSGLPKPKQSK